MCVHTKTLLGKVIPQSGRRYLQNTYPPQVWYYLFIFHSTICILGGEGGGKSLDQTIDKDKSQMATKHTKSCSTMLVTGETQINITVRNHNTLTRIFKVRNWTTHVGKVVEQMSTHILLMGMQSGRTPLKKYFVVLNKAKCTPMWRKQNGS